MIPYEQTKAGWDKAAETNADAAIHPAGAKSKELYDATGVNDANLVTNTICEYIHDDEQWSPSYSSIIDFGCGNGRVAIPIAKEFGYVYAVDFSYAMLQQLPKDTNIEPVLSVDNNFCLSPKSADYAFSISVFIHNTYESGVKIMQSISDNLKPGGLALLQIPIYEYPRTPNSYIDVGVWTIEGLEAAANKTGFEILEVYTNRGHFDYGHIGSNHYKFQILRKK